MYFTHYIPIQISQMSESTATDNQIITVVIIWTDEGGREKR